MKNILFVIMVLVFTNYSYSQDSPCDSITLQKLKEREQRKIDRRALSNQYGNNIIRLVPFRMPDYPNVGFGIEYEHIFGKNKFIGINLPFTYSLKNEPFEHTFVMNRNSYYYFSPGLKFYPIGQRKVNYAVGPTISMCYGKGQIYNRVFDNYKLSVLVNNYFNLQFTPHLNLGVEFGLGYQYIDRYIYKYKFSGITEDRSMHLGGNLAITFGYRF